MENLQLLLTNAQKDIARLSEEISQKNMMLQRLIGAANLLKQLINEESKENEEEA